MSADRQALIDAIRDEPDNERLRLVYADWLEDNGHPERAEYVRLCYELSGLDADDPHAAGLERRRGQLFRKHQKTWGPGLIGDAAGRLKSRGLVQCVEMPAVSFLKCADRLRVEPVCTVKLTNASKYVKKLAACAALADVRELILYQSDVDESDVQALAESPHLKRLRVLRLVSCGVTTPEAAALAEAPWLANLRTLDLSHYERRDRDVNNAIWRNVGIFRAIAAGHTNHLGDDGFRALLESPHLGNLETLIVANNWISTDSARLLWTGTRVPKLRRLDMSYNYLLADGLLELIGSPLMKRLESLEIQANEVGPEAVAALAASRNVRNLKLLDVSGTTAYDDRPKLTSAAAEAIANSANLKNLEHLVLTFCAITAPGAVALAKTTKLKSLKTLCLSNNPVCDRGARAFAASPLLGQLETLDLSACSVTAAAAKAFARSKTAGDQLNLDLALNAVGEEAADALRERFGERVTLQASTPDEFSLDEEDEMPF
jgi:uncharacterized protein (TIGR02996 family)